MHTLIPIALSHQPVGFVSQDAWTRMGLIVLATDLTSERDYARLFPHDTASVYTTRVAFENPTTPENLRLMEPRLAAAAELLLPEEPLAAICFSCTAASVVIGDDAVTEAIQRSRPGVPVVTPAGAAVKALRALNVSKVAILTPYLIETSQSMADYFSRNKFGISDFECLGLEDDREMARVDHHSIVEAACRLDGPDNEAIFISCTGLPALSTISEIEARTGKPVVTSNQASAWVMMRLAGLSHRPTGYGRLFSHDLSEGGVMKSRTSTNNTSSSLS
ncbi:aspartate/glutamate racemase family protein [Granulosicoccus antarcticus]|uniref:Arylmalonate decarboxylase n=1 Tax=Granulosicoccus antarcticus IMCC3135 TaxID=1192854 RepID=A0A2Z2NKX7_9GAMM|nr:aspartate/glutamate racemase family protein [Granulosicoccus antarcticus]ASJ72072.1 Arylmalonate decarboxylase [Granulosicoccus antarcticus IMCC3135]